MKFKLSKSISEFLTSANTIIQNTKNDSEILSKVAEFGYTLEKILEGEQLLRKAEELNRISISKKGDKEHFSDGFNKIYKEAKNVYYNFRKIAKAIFLKEKGKLEQLGLNDKVPQGYAGFISKCNILFDNSLSDEEIKNKLAEYGYDENRITKEREKINQLIEIYLKRESAKGDAQQLTVEKNKAFEELYRWISQYIKIARIALSDNRETIEKLGIKIKPKGRKSRTDY